MSRIIPLYLYSFAERKITHKTHGSCKLPFHFELIRNAPGNSGAALMSQFQ